MDAEDQRQAEHDAVRREMERKSNDEIMIHNPTQDDYQIRWNRYVHIVPNYNKDNGHGKGNLVVTRYLAIHYATHMIDKLIMDESDAIVDKAKEEYKGTYWPQEELRVALKTSNIQLRQKYMKIIWKGTVRKFGVDEIPTEEAARKKDERSIDEQLLDELDFDFKEETSKPVEKKMPGRPRKKLEDEFEKSIQWT